MDPRKKASRNQKSTNLPKEFLENVEQLFAKTFKKQLKGQPIIVEGRIYSDEILMSVGFKEDPKALRQTNFEASLDHKGKDLMKRLGICVDAISSMMEQFFETDGDIDLPRQWQPFPFDQETIYLQSSGRNTELEAEANKILGLKRGDELIIEEGEDPEEMVEDDDLDDDPDDEPEDPEGRNETKH